MLNKKTIANALYKAIDGGRISFHTALRIYGPFDRLFSRPLSKTQRDVRKFVSGHVQNATAPGSKMCWTSVLFPAELLYPFGIHPVTLEVISGLFATLGLANIFIDKADASDIPNTMCSFHRVLLGVTDTQFMGKPALVGSVSAMCDGNLKSFAEAAKYQGVPFLFIDIPYQLTKDSVEYVKGQMKEAIPLLEEISGVKFDMARLKEAAVNANETFKYNKAFYKALSASDRNLFRGHEVANFAFPMHFLLGSRGLVDIMKARSEAFAKDQSHHKFFAKKHYGKKAKRIMWLHIVPQYDNELWGIIDNGETARIVCDEYSSVQYDEYDLADPLGSIAKRLISHPSNGPLERRIEHILKVAKEHNVEGMVHYTSWGCHQAAGNVQMLGKAMLDAGYKFLNLSSDPVDERNTSAEQHRTRLEAFLEN